MYILNHLQMVLIFCNAPGFYFQEMSVVVGCCRIHNSFLWPRSGSRKIINGGDPESPTLFIHIATLHNNSDLITNTSIFNQIMSHFAFWATRHTWRHSIIFNLNIVDNLQSSVLVQSVALCSPPLIFVPIDPTQSAFICIFGYWIFKAIYSQAIINM